MRLQIGFIFPGKLIRDLWSASRTHTAAMVSNIALSSTDWTCSDSNVSREFHVPALRAQL